MSAVYTTAGALIREYVYLDDAPLAQVDAGTPEVLTYLHTDHLGTPRFGTNTGGTQVWAWASDAFGVGAPSGARTVNLRMPGQYYDAESSLFYNWNRYYNPAIGRYVSSDPIGIDGGLNTFLYAEASPVMHTDPEGRSSIVWGAIKRGAKGWLPNGASKFLDELDPLRIKSVADATCRQNGVNVCSIKSSSPSMSVAQPSVCTAADSAGFPIAFQAKGYWPADRGAEEWGRRHNVPSDEARRKFHGIKQGAKGKGKDNYGVNPDTGDIIDQNGESVGNLGE